MNNKQNNEQNAQALIDKIIEEAELDAKNITEQGELDVKAIFEATASEIESINADADKKINDITNSILESYRTNAEPEARKHSLLSRRSMLDKVFEKALERIEALSGYERGELLVNLAKNNASGGEVIRPSKADKDALTKVLPTINKAFDKPLTIGEVYDGISSGFILEAELYEIDCSFKSLLDDVRDDFEGEVADILFK